MKMSDYFASKVTLETAAGEGFLLKDAKCEYDEDYLAIILELRQAKAITHAINNHDLLTEENANLRKALLDLLKFTGILTSDKECVINAKKLLKEQNNDK